MKTKYILLGLILLTVLSMSMTVMGASEYEVTEDRLYVYEIMEFDEDVMEDTLVYSYSDMEDYLGPDSEVGAMMAVMVTDVDEADDLGPGNDIDGWEIDLWVWDVQNEGWVDDEDDFEDPDTDEITEYDKLELYDDAADYGEIPSFFWIDVSIVNGIFRYTGIPTSVEDWLGDLDFFSDAWDADENTLTWEFEDDGIIFNDDGEYIWTWNNKGEFVSYEIYGGGDLMYELRLKGGLLSGIPGYELPLLIGVAGVSAIGIIYIIIRRNK